MPTPTKDEMIRAAETIEKSVLKLEIFVIQLTEQGLHEEAALIGASIIRLKQSLARIRVNEEGKVVLVQ